MWDVVGHQRIIEELQGAIDRERLPHALLFVGPAEIGKTRLAIELAKVLNCTGEHPPCGACVHCCQIEASSHPDVTIIERTEGKDSISIAQVRELREAASLRPFQGRQKVYVLAGADALTPQAADALLKTLEEPQRYVSLILTASEVDSLPSTIVSRCRLISVAPLERGEIDGALRVRGQTPETAARIARLAQGRMGWALRVAKTPKLLLQTEQMIGRLGAVPRLGLEERLQLAEDLAGERKDRGAVRRNLELFLLLMRDVMLLSLRLEPQLVDTAPARAYSLAEIHAALNGIRTAMQRIDQNVDPRLALEALFMQLP